MKLKKIAALSFSLYREKCISLMDRWKEKNKSRKKVSKIWRVMFKRHCACAVNVVITADCRAMSAIIFLHF
jgi:hypothetical protein